MIRADIGGRFNTGVFRLKDAESRIRKFWAVVKGVAVEARRLRSRSQRREVYASVEGAVADALELV